MQPLMRLADKNRFFFWTVFMMSNGMLFRRADRDPPLLTMLTSVVLSHMTQMCDPSGTLICFTSKRFVVISRAFMWVDFRN